MQVLLADDSPTVRAALRALIEGAELGEVEAVGDGAKAVERVARGGVGLVLMDLLMPGMGGLEAVRRIMAEHPTPIVVVSDLVGRDARANFEAVAAGALDVMRKPTADELADPAFVRRLLRRLKVMAGTPVVRRRMRTGRMEVAARETVGAASVELVCVGASTGGPDVVRRLVEAMADAPWPTLVVQHMAPGFAPGLVDWLAGVTGATVVLAEAGTRPRPGVVSVAPDGHQLELVNGHLRLRPAEPGDVWAPSIDALFTSVARESVAGATAAALLTGMGSDGAAGLTALREAGAWTCAQRPESCVVPSMPQSAIAAGGVSEVLSPGQLARRLSEWISAARGETTDGTPP